MQRPPDGALRHTLPGNEGTQLLGCLIRDWDYSDAVIVYVADPERPWLANRILRHEIGHLLGWPGTHTPGGDFPVGAEVKRLPEADEDEVKGY